VHGEEDHPARALAEDALDPELVVDDRPAKALEHREVPHVPVYRPGWREVAYHRHE
jgi:hypothetical protein